jgi:hypothetical protein
MTIHGLVKYDHEKSTLGIHYAQNLIIIQIKDHLITSSKPTIN